MDKEDEGLTHCAVRRKIAEASICLRFYVSDGWTREDVRQMLASDKRLDRVVPRYFDERDPLLDGMELHDGLPHENCDYFAVYDKAEPFSLEALAYHELVGFLR